MEHEQDPELGNLLSQWHVPPHSASLEARVLGAGRQPWWKFLLMGSIKVPVPVAVGLAVLLTFGAWRASRAETMAPCLSENTTPPSVACPASAHC